MTATNTHRDNPFPHRHLLGIEGLHPHEILGLLDRAEEAVEVSRQIHKRKHVLAGRTQINLFFEAKNITNTAGVRYVGSPDRIIEFEKFGAFYFVGARVNF